MLNGKIVAILATDGYEQSELRDPVEALQSAGAKTVIVAPESGRIRGVEGHEWADSVDVDKALSNVRADDFDALVLPGGVYNPDALRQNERAVALVRSMFEAKKTVAAICHAPWLLIEADIVKGRSLTSYSSIKTDLINAGANWVDEEVVEEFGLVTSRSPDDLDAFCRKVIEVIESGPHEERTTGRGQKAA